MAEHDETPEISETLIAPPKPPRKWSVWRLVKRVILVLSCVMLGLVLLGVIAQWTGLVDRYVAGRIKARLAQFGVKFEMGHFETSFGPAI